MSRAEAPTIHPQLLHDVQPEAEPFPYQYRMSGTGTRHLPSWEALSDLLHLLGLDAGYSFLIVDRSDGCERWAQVIGHPERMVVELGLPDEPMRVHRTADDHSHYLLTSSLGSLVDARHSDLFTAAEAQTLIRTWLERGLLGLDGTALRTPDDWA